MKPKSVFASKTLWFNVLWLVVAVAGQFGFRDFKPAGALEQLVPILLPAIVNIVLRFYTSRPVQLS